MRRRPCHHTNEDAQRDQCQLACLLEGCQDIDRPVYSCIVCQCLGTDCGPSSYKSKHEYRGQDAQNMPDAS